MSDLFTGNFLDGLDNVESVSYKVDSFWLKSSWRDLSLCPISDNCARKTVFGSALDSFPTFSSLESKKISFVEELNGVVSLERFSFAEKFRLIFGS